MDTMGERLRAARKNAKFGSARSAAIRFGWPPSTYAAHENGQNEFDAEAAQDYARAFRVSAAWLLTGERQADRWEVPIMGRIGAGAEIEPEHEQVPAHGLWTLELPFPIPEEMVGFEVKGDSMLPRYDDGDVILVYREQTRAIESFFGEEAAVRTKDGRRFLKVVRRGPERGTFTLDSFNAKPIEGVRLEWIGEIYLTLRSGQLRRIVAREKAIATRRTRHRERLTAGMEQLALPAPGKT